MRRYSATTGIKQKLCPHLLHFVSSIFTLFCYPSKHLHQLSPSLLFSVFFPLLVFFLESFASMFTRADSCFRLSFLSLHKVIPARQNSCSTLQRFEKPQSSAAGAALQQTGSLKHSDSQHGGTGSQTPLKNC